jgi:hypothetical protein
MFQKTKNKTRPQHDVVCGVSYVVFGVLRVMWCVVLCVVLLCVVCGRLRESVVAVCALYLLHFLSHFLHHFFASIGTVKKAKFRVFGRERQRELKASQARDEKNGEDFQLCKVSGGIVFYTWIL